MTSIHALIPTDLKNVVMEAKHRGEDPSPIPEEKDDTNIQRPRKQQRLQTGATKKPVRKPTPSNDVLPQPHTHPEDPMSDSEHDDPASASKENNPSLSPTPVRLAQPSPRKNALGKRPLSVLAMPYPEDPDADMMLVDSDSETESHTAPMNASDQNISANMRTRSSVSPLRKSPKLTLRKGGNTPYRLGDGLQIYEDVPHRSVSEFGRRFSGDGKENRTSRAGGMGVKERRELRAGTMGAGSSANALSAGHMSAVSASSKSSSLHADPSSSRVSKKVVGGARKVSAPKTKPRIGVRRL